MATRAERFKGRFRRKFGLVDRFWSRVTKRSDGCWWINGSPVKRDGHIRLMVDGAYVFAHRFSYELHVGPIPDGLFVLHHCDVPRCVNPDHLFVGTIRDNVHDAIAKGRHSSCLSHARKVSQRAQVGV